MKSLLQNLVVLLARVLLREIFLFSAVGHLMNWGGTTKMMTAQGMVYVHFMLIVINVSVAWRAVGVVGLLRPGRFAAADRLSC